MGCCCLQNHMHDEDINQNLTDSRVLIRKNQQAQVLKKQGNDYFKRKAYQNAIKCYSQALIKNPTEMVYYTNLALAYKADNRFQDAIRIIDEMHLQKFSVSKNYSDFMSKGKIIKVRCINALAKLYIISNLYSQQQSDNVLSTIQQAIKLLNEAKRMSNVQIDEYLNNSLKIKMYLNKIKKKTSEFQVVDYLKKRIKQSSQGLHKQNNWSRIQLFISNQNELLKQIQSRYTLVHRKFLEEAQEDQQHFIDPITYQKYRQPVILPSGITYEQKTLREYFKKNNQYRDPITKQQFQLGQKVMIPNNSIRNYIHQMGKINEIRKEDIQLLIC